MTKLILPLLLIGLAACTPADPKEQPVSDDGAKEKEISQFDPVGIWVSAVAPFILDITDVPLSSRKGFTDSQINELAEHIKNKEDNSTYPPSWEERKLFFHPQGDFNSIKGYWLKSDNSDRKIHLYYDDDVPPSKTLYFDKGDLLNTGSGNRWVRKKD